MSATPWLTPPEGFQVGPAFKNDLEAAHWFELYVAALLLQEGFPVQVKKVEVASSREDMARFTEQKDVIVGCSDNLHIEVKSQTESWTGPDDIPHHWPGLILSKVHRYQARLVKPVAHVVVSRPTLATIVVFDDTAPFWREWTCPDPHGQVNTNWLAPRSCFRTFEDLVDLLTVMVEEGE